MKYRYWFEDDDDEDDDDDNEVFTIQGIVLCEIT